MITMRLVLDTNIVMDMLHFSNPHTQHFFDVIHSGTVECFTDATCLAELDRVTGYPEFELDALGRKALMDAYLNFVTVYNPDGEETYVLPRCRDADDQKFLILAARCHADMLITRDKLLLRLARHRRTPPPFNILTAEVACKLLQPASKHPAVIV